MTRVSPAEHPAEKLPPSPWERFGWLMGVVWLVFLAFPLLEAWRLEGQVARWTAVTALVVFAVVYVIGLWRQVSGDSWAIRDPRGVVYLVVLVALFVLTFALVGIEATGMTNYLLAFSFFLRPYRLGATLGVLWILVTTTIVLTVGEPARDWFYIGINLMVSGFVGVVAAIDSRQDDHDRLVRELDVVAERERVARDVHDVLGHSLTVVTVRAELAERLVDSDPEAAKAELAQLRALTREALGEVRATVAGLRVARLGEELDAARRALAGAGIEAELPASPDGVDPRHRLVLAWVLREAVTNAVRHSGATRCVVRLGTDWMTVEDDGVGLGGGDPESSGLRGARERVEGTGGVLTVGPARGEEGAAGDGAGRTEAGRPGTRLEVRW